MLPHPIPRPLLARHWLLLLLLLVFSSAAAAPAFAKPKPTQIGDVIFGFDNRIIPERWAPITVSLLPGDEPFDGVLSLAFGQDASQRAVIMHPAAATPGRAVPVTLVAALPSGTRKIELTLMDRAGNTVDSAKFTFGSDDERRLPPFAAERTLAVIAPPDSGLSAGFFSRYKKSPEAEGEPKSAAGAVTDDIVFAIPRPASYPDTPSAYDALNLMVVQAAQAEALQPRQLTAIRQWVLSGGRLVIVAAGPGALWRQWLPPGPPGELLTAADPQIIPAPASLASVLAAEPVTLTSTIFATDITLSQRRVIKRDSSGKPSASSSTPPAETPPTHAAIQPTPAAAKIPVRGLSLSAAAIASGWSVRWPFDPRSPGAGLLAEGPVGFGWVTVLGFDPLAVPAVVDIPASERLWADALRIACRDMGRSDATRNWFSRASGDSPFARAAISDITDHLCEAPPIGHSVAWFIGGSLVLLALLIGPGDYFVLGRLKARPKSWITAPVWILIASCAAYIAPRLLRTGETTVNRLNVIDVLADPAAPLAWQTSLTDVFSGDTSRVDWTGLPPGAQFRGVSSLNYRQDDTSLLPTVMLAQSPAALVGGDDPYGGVSTTAPAVAQTLPVPGGTSLRRWTLRTFLDDARVHSPLIGLTLTDPASGRRAVRIGGLPSGAEITGAFVRTADGWHEAALAPSADGRECLVTLNPKTLETRPAEFEPYAAPPDQAFYGNSRPIRKYRPSAALQLSGPDRRSIAIDARISGGAWAAVYMEVRNLPPDATISRADKAKRSAVVRLLVPASGWPAAPTPAPTQTPTAPTKDSQS